MYESALHIEFETNRLQFLRQNLIPVLYKGRPIGEHRIDFWVERSVIVELKAVERHDPVFEAQVITYLKLTGCRLGLLINFNRPLLRDGVRRLIV